MTGYAAGTRETDYGIVSFELKSVNARYLDFQFRLCDALRAAESALRERISARVRRGKLECRMWFSAASPPGGTLAYNEKLLESLREYEARVLYELPSARPVSVNEVLRWPGMLEDVSSETGLAEALPAALALAGEVLGDFLASRAREGEKLASDIRNRAAAARECASRIEPWISEAQNSFQEKLKQRLAEALAAPDDARISLEAALFATRIDVSEELARLAAHLDEVDRVLDSGGECGKRLDFLMQELNREANTLGSKSMISEVSKAAMELKLLIEQMREQIQNLE
jgi:uncharacterized protein (TIGR00255 family)